MALLNKEQALEHLQECNNDNCIRRTFMRLFNQFTISHTQYEVMRWHDTEKLRLGLIDILSK